MAQPLFEQHPLEDYFRQTGEFAEPMPGSSADFSSAQDPIMLDDDDDGAIAHTELQLPQFVVQAVQLIHGLLQSSSATASGNAFAEHFKYDVISSSLLASSLAAPVSSVRRAFSPEIPGKLDDKGGGGQDGVTSKDPETDDMPSHVDTTTSSPNSLEPQLSYVFLSLAVLALSTNHNFLAIILASTAAYVRHVVNTDSEKSDTTKQTIESLNELISAGNVWDSAVNEAMMLIESEERSIFYGPTSSQAPSSALRLTLQSSLQTTQTQCDNVRQLLSALTSPTSLSQLAEMYAPSSPVRPALSLLDTPRSPISSTMRPFSVPTTTPWRQRTTSFPTTSPTSKRATWNGSYAALAAAGSPTAQMLKRKQMNRRSDLASLFQPQPSFSSASAPVSPQPPSPTANAALSDVTEEDDTPAPELESKGYFGAAALDLRRKRMSAGLEAFNIPPPSYTSSAEQSLTDYPLRSPVRATHSRTGSGVSPVSTIASSSRLTAVHTTRHPLSLSGLHLALQGALSAKRYSCSHLLALRFNEDEDESYWENVRSVMALLTSAFSDASSRLVEALDDAEKRRIKDEQPTPPSGPTHLRRDSSISPLRNEDIKRARSMAEMVSFAPMPSNMSRFGAHVDALSTALNDARDHLEVCVAALRDTSSRRHSLESEDGVPSVQGHPAFQAYDRLRKELGFALRECERGRERLLDIIAGPRAITEAVEDEDAHTPGLKQDSGSESSEKGPVSPNVQLDLQADDAGLGLELDEHGHDLDDATAHLLLTASSQHLPPAGAEQVYEAETGNSAPFTRERSKLSREERIKIAKARRASGVPLSSVALVSQDDVERKPRGEQWGPGGEVVQELKDVIWKVGEKRRKFSERAHPPPSEDAPVAIPPAAASVGADTLEFEPMSPGSRELLRPGPIDTQRTELPAVVVAHGAEETDMS
ncbi:hypothetical protein C8Q79DRAFT_994564 [Trametes meyenii]|nr:hypothetical protein C8Q79DRAFT_994564 [Trametes meyenii]